MTLKIDSDSDEQEMVLRLSGRLQSEHMALLKALIEGSEQRVVLDLQDVKLVDLDVVRFLGGCEADGVELRNCSPYIREWVLKEKASS